MSIKKRSTCKSYFSPISRTVKKLPRDFDILRLSIFKNALCIQYLANCFPLQHSDCAISFSWCGNTKSSPPAWISISSPKYFLDITEHSMCHPGLPSPHGDTQNGSPSFFGFHNTKSRGSSFWFSPDTWMERKPDCKSSRFLWDSFPYSLKFFTRKYTVPFTS